MRTVWKAPGKTEWMTVKEKPQRTWPQQLMFAAAEA